MTTHDIRRLGDEFQQQGFMHVPQLLAQQEVAELRAAAIDLTAERATDQWNCAGIISTTDAWEHHPTAPWRLIRGSDDVTDSPSSGVEPSRCLPGC